jgi:predicted SnoaL-like aldol condensation-catalyzing enzyme
MSTPEQNKQTLLAYFQRVLNERDFSAFATFFAPDYRDHDAPEDAPSGPRAVEDFMVPFLGDFPDMSARVADLLAEGNRVAARVFWLGHHRETGEAYHKMGIIIVSFDEQARMRERWSAYTGLPG